jgi:7-keto-8-aminopelargonate synthetase-like enzyme
MYENGLVTTPFIYPSVPVNGGRIRLIAGANLREESIERAVKTIKELNPHPDEVLSDT